MKSQKEIINKLNLEPHPEGGFYRETYRSDEMVVDEAGEKMSAGTGIYFLLPEGVCTSWHRVTSDEFWHFYEGEEMMLEIINKEGVFGRFSLSNDLEFQKVVPRNCWQRAYSLGEYSLVGCTVCPGFEFTKFEMMEADELAEHYPEIGNEIKRNPFS